VLGGVAHKPWRVDKAEREIVGRRLNEASISAAARASVEAAQPLRDNAFKVELARRAVAQALRNAGGIT
jgi:xanthine dehydrogenase YagS FAD-binding subunit